MSQPPDDNGKVVPIGGAKPGRAATWEGVRAAWANVQRLGWQAVREAALVGEMLFELETSHEFWQRAAEIGISGRTAPSTMAVRTDCSASSGLAIRAGGG